jgi:DNA-directed RNA polymerase subunit H (RpoH/RPB5)
MSEELNPGFPEHNTALKRLFKVKQTELAMISCRGYNINRTFQLSSIVDKKYNFAEVDLSHLANPSFSYQDFLGARVDNNLFKSRQDFTAIYYKGVSPICVVYVGNEPNSQTTSKYMTIVKVLLLTFSGTDSDINDWIIVSQNGLNAESLNFIKTNVAGKHIEVFLDVQLAYKYIAHSYCPISVSIIRAEDVEKWAVEENIQPEKLPMILSTDPIVKWYGAKPHDVVISEILGTIYDSSIMYRIVRQNYNS